MSLHSLCNVIRAHLFLNECNNVRMDDSNDYYYKSTFPRNNNDNREASLQDVNAFAMFVRILLAGYKSVCYM